MRTEIKLKYCKVSFNEDWHDTKDGRELCIYSTIEFEWGEKATSLAVAFSALMDKKIEERARCILIPLLKVERRDIALEDTWLMVQGYNEDNKHHVATLLAVAKEAESEFDNMITVRQ